MTKEEIDKKEEKKADGYTKVPHKLWDTDITLNERYMMLFLLDCENRFNKTNDWFSLTDEDFIHVGFGKDKQVIRSTRKKLLERQWISFKRAAGKKSLYKLLRKKISKE